MFTQTQIEEFKIGLALLDGMSASASREKLIDLGDDYLPTAAEKRLVSTHETFADFSRSRGRPTESRTTPAGFEIHHWQGVQFRKGQPRVHLYLMEFEGGANASYIR